MDCRKQEIITKLLESYQSVGGINHCQGTQLPSKEVVAGLCSDLLHLLFPGFFGEIDLTQSELSIFVNELIHSFHDQMSEEVHKCLCLCKEKKNDIQKKSSQLACDFLMELPNVRAMLATDVAAAFEGDPAAGSYEEIILAYPGLEAIAIQRAAHVMYGLKIPLLPRMMTEWAHSRTGIDIHPGAEIGSHFFIDHGTGVVIGETSQIGSHVKLYQGVGLVARSLAAGQALQGKKRHPTLGDHVTIYAGATIVGGDTVIGARSTIGANVFLMESVAEDRVYVLGEQYHKVKDRRHKKPEAEPSIAIQFEI
jgi:serine O-acetyltransferase